MTRNTLSRRNLLRNLLSAATVTSLSPRLFSQSTAATPPQVEQVLQQYMKKYSIPGIALACARGPQVLYSGAFGEANKSGHQPVQLDSLFRIASNSKAFTSTSIFLLIEQGKLSLEDKVFTPDGLLPQFSALGPHRDWIHAITLHQLLTHTAGGWGNENNDPMFQKPGLNQEQLIAWTLKTIPLQNPPGQKYAYSNFGYCVLGRVIERIGGQPYAQFVRQHVLRPAGIQDMRIATHKPAPNEVHYYGQGGQDPYQLPITRMDSHGGWIATALDLSRFLAALFSPKDNEGSPALLTASSLTQMTQGTQANPGYACGLAVNTAGNAWHAGSLPGTTCLMVHTRSGMSWAATLNSRSTNDAAEPELDKILWQIARSVPQWHA